MDIGMPELVVVLVIVLLIFGAGRIARIGGELGQAIKGFRTGLTDQSAAPAGSAVSFEQPVGQAAPAGTPEQPEPSTN